MYVIIWEYHVKPEHVDGFERTYGSEGEWVELFKKHPSFLGTELLRNANHPQRYITIDRWISAEAYNSFRAARQDEYRALDALCESLTDRELLLGALSPIQSGG